MAPNEMAVDGKVAFKGCAEIGKALREVRKQIRNENWDTAYELCEEIERAAYEVKCVVNGMGD